MEGCLSFSDWIIWRKDNNTSLDHSHFWTKLYYTATTFQFPSLAPLNLLITFWISCFRFPIAFVKTGNLRILLFLLQVWNKQYHSHFHLIHESHALKRPCISESLFLDKYNSILDADALWNKDHLSSNKVVFVGSKSWQLIECTC